MNEVHINARELQFMDQDLNCIKVLPLEYLVHATLRPMTLGVIGGWIKETDAPKAVWLVDAIAILIYRHELLKLNQGKKS